MFSNELRELSSCQFAFGATTWSKFQRQAQLGLRVDLASSVDGGIAVTMARVIPSQPQDYPAPDNDSQSSSSLPRIDLGKNQGLYSLKFWGPGSKSCCHRIASGKFAQPLLCNGAAVRLGLLGLPSRGGTRAVACIIKEPKSNPTPVSTRRLVRNEQSSLKSCT